MKKADQILAEVKKIFASKWDIRDGIKVPEPDDITLGNNAVRLNGTVLYADMSDSTALVDRYKEHFAAEIYKCYLIASCHIIRNNSGEIVSFDGDRVMAIYLGASKNSQAAKSALQINWAINAINSQLTSTYPNSTYKLKHSVGIDTSSLWAVRSGIRDSNDLVWVGKAANYAAKLNGIQDPSYSLFITEEVYKALNDEAKYGGNPKEAMWERARWSVNNAIIYKSNWSWTPQ